MLKIENAIRKEIENKNPKYITAYQNLYIKYKDKDFESGGIVAQIFEQVYMPKDNGLLCLQLAYGITDLEVKKLRKQFELDFFNMLTN